MTEFSLNKFYLFCFIFSKNSTSLEKKKKFYSTFWKDIIRVQLDTGQWDFFLNKWNNSPFFHQSIVNRYSFQSCKIMLENFNAFFKTFLSWFHTLLNKIPQSVSKCFLQIDTFWNPPYYPIFLNEFNFRDYITINKQVGSK